MFALNSKKRRSCVLLLCCCIRILTLLRRLNLKSPLWIKFAFGQNLDYLFLFYCRQLYVGKNKTLRIGMQLNNIPTYSLPLEALSGFDCCQLVGLCRRDNKFADTMEVVETITSIDVCPTAQGPANLILPLTSIVLAYALNCKCNTEV